jgi:hypothetical protein
MLTPRVSRLEEPSPTLTQPLMFFVTAWARSARPQALTTRWLAPDATRSREHSSEAALTLTARTALAPNGLRTTLHATQNTYRRIRKYTKFYPRARYHPLGCPREAGDAAYPFARPLCRDAPSRAPRFRSSYAEPDSCLSADEPTRPKIRPIDDCNPTCQKRALVVSRCYRVACQSCPWRAAMSEAVHAATTRFGRRFPQCREHSPLAALLELRHL